MAKKKTILDLYKMKENGEKAVWMVMYDSLFASYAEEAGMDMILCGDSMGMIVYGYEGTVPVTMDMSIAHCQGVRRGAPCPLARTTPAWKTPCATRCASIKRQTSMP